MLGFSLSPPNVAILWITKCSRRLEPHMLSLSRYKYADEILLFSGILAPSFFLVDLEINSDI